MVKSFKQFTNKGKKVSDFLHTNTDAGASDLVKKIAPHMDLDRPLDTKKRSLDDHFKMLRQNGFKRDGRTEASTTRYRKTFPNTHIRPHNTDHSLEVSLYHSRDYVSKRGDFGHVGTTGHTGCVSHRVNGHGRDEPTYFHGPHGMMDAIKTEHDKLHAKLANPKAWVDADNARTKANGGIPQYHVKRPDEK